VAIRAVSPSVRRAGMQSPQSEAALRKRDSVAMLGAHETVWAAEAEKTQNRQCCDQQKRVHHFLLSAGLTSCATHQGIL
jgi:hypothetical protein